MSPNAASLRQSGQLTARAWGLSDVGRKRSHNEDSFLVNPELATFVVADGMGGHAHGELASRMAVEIVEEEVFRQRRRKPSPFEDSEVDSVVRVVATSVQMACSRIFDLAQRNREYFGMGTTVTAIVVNGGHAFLAHVGDSRAYMMRDGEIHQLTEDHSWVHEQVKSGLLTEEEARTSRFKNIITRSVGVERDVKVDTTVIELHPRDLFLLCSDGLSNLVTDIEIRETARGSYYQKVPAQLIDLANARGGDDNTTVVLVEVIDASEIAA